MKKILAYLMVGIAFTGCNSLDLEPISSIADNKYWQTEAQVDAFNVGLHSKFREKCSYSIFSFWRTSLRIIILESQHLVVLPRVMNVCGTTV